MLYAAYGSNLHPIRLGRRLVAPRLVGTAFVEGRAVKFHKRSRIDGSGKGNLAGQGDGTWLAIFELDAADFGRLDRIEGVGLGYDRVVLEVPGYAGCMTYVAQPDYVDDALRPYDWYLELVLAGCRYHRFPAHYVESLAAVPSTADADRQRAAQNFTLLESMRTA